MVNLEELVFKVNTQELDAASKKLDALANSLAAVGKATKAAGNSGGTGGGMEKPLEKVTTAAKAAEKSLERVALQAQYVQQGFSKLDAGRIAGIAQKFGEGSVQVQQMINNLKVMSSSVTTVTTEVDKQTKAVGSLRAGYMSVEERQKSITEFMTQGFSRGQSSILTTAKNLGAVGDELARIGVELQTQRKLQGGDPFDKSQSGLLALKNRYTELREANRQYIKDTQLTRDQTRELARDKERLIIKLKQEGAGFQEIRSVIREHNQSFLDAANRVNGLTKVEADLERQMRETANSVRALAREEEKVDSIVNSLTGSTNTHTKTSERAAESIARYERNLRLAGVTGEQAANKLEIYRKKINQISDIEEKRKSRLLSNSLAPQISDVVVSLAGGQNPLTVALQQGLQVRDLIGLSGVAAQELDKVFATAASSMVASLAQTGKAIGSLLIGSIQAAGRAVIQFGSDITGTTALLGNLRKSVEGFPRIAKIFDGFAMLSNFAAGGLIGLAIAGVVALGVALKQTIAQEDALAKALTLSGASLGLSQTQALEYADSMRATGVSTASAIKVMQEMAKQSTFTAGQFFVISQAAADMEKYVGVSIEDTVKAYGKLSEKPVEGLLELAKATGLVAPEVIKLVAELERQGKTAEATSLAITTMADVNELQVARMKEDYNGLSLFLINLATSIKSFYDDVFRSLFTKASPKEAIKEQLAAVNDILKGAGAAGMLGIGNYFGRDFYENQRNELSKQLLLMEKVEQSESDRVTTNRELALIQGKAEKVRTEGLTSELKYLNKVKELSNEIVKARALGASDDTINALQQGITKAADDYEKTLKKAERTRKSPEENFEAKSLREFVNNTVEASFAQDELSKSQLKVLKIVQDPLWATLKEDQKLRILGLFQEAYAAEELNKTLEVNKVARAAAQKEDFDAQAKRLDLMADFDIVSRDANEALVRENEDLVFQASLIGKTAEERKKLIEIRKIELALEKELAVIRATYKDDAGLAGQLEQANKRAQERIANLSKQVAIDAAQQMQTQLSDAIETALFEGGKAGSKKLRDIVTAELRKPIRVFIEAIVGNITGSIFGGGSGSAGIGSGTNAEGGGGISGLSSLSSIYDMLSGGLNVGSQAGAGLAKLTAKAIGQFGASTATTMAGSFASGMMSTGTMASAGEALAAGGSQLAGLAVGSIMNGISGYGISKALSGGYSTGGNTVNVLAGLASMIPGVGPIAGVIGGVVNRAFGRKAPVTTGQDLRGNFSTTGADVAQYQTNFSKGGWFRSNKTTVTRSEISGELDKYLDTSLQAITATTKQFASILGLIPEAINGVSQSINIALLGLNSEQQQTAIQNALGGFSDLLAQQLLGTWTTTSVQVKKSYAERYMEAITQRIGTMEDRGRGPGSMFRPDANMVSEYKTVTTTKWTPGAFVREGESAFAALTRLATSLTTVNGVFDTLSQTLMHASLIGADAASSLLDAFGGVEIFNNLTTAYYNEYYTAQEKVATTTRQLSKIFEGMGLTLPTTRDGFKMLVEAQDLYTEKGRETYAALLNLSPAFASITAAVEQFTSALIDEVRRLRGEASTASGNGLGFYQSQFAMATGAARAGDAGALERLPELSKAVEEAAKLQAASTEDFIRIQSWLIASLSETSALAGSPVPAFAAGGMHSGGARIVGENGPELEITGASRIFNANQTANMLGGGNLAELIVQLNDNISGLRAEVRADVGHNAKTAKLLDRVIPDGQTIAVTVV